jgi:dephospho-CoA kinase
VKKQPLILGITGAFGSGKSTASHYFTKQGFTRIALSSFLESEIRKSGKTDITRKTLQDMGNKLRKKFGSGILAQKALVFIDEKKLDRVVIDGIRSMGEIEVLCTRPEFVSIAIVSDRVVRYERLQAHPRREPLTTKVFAQLDYRDLGVGEKEYGLQTGLCIALADVFIENNGTVKAFEGKLDTYLKGIIEEDE